MERGEEEVSSQKVVSHGDLGLALEGGSPTITSRDYHRLRWAAIQFSQQGRHSSAQRAASAALAVCPHDFEILAVRAECALHLGLSGCARRDAEVMMLLNMENVEGWVLAGEANRRLHHFENARECFSRAVQLCPEHAEWQDMLRICEEELEKLRRRRPDHRPLTLPTHHIGSVSGTHHSSPETSKRKTSRASSQLSWYDVACSAKQPAPAVMLEEHGVPARLLFAPASSQEQGTEGKGDGGTGNEEEGMVDQLEDPLALKMLPSGTVGQPRRSHCFSPKIPLGSTSPRVRGSQGKAPSRLTLLSKFETPADKLQWRALLIRQAEELGAKLEQQISQGELPTVSSASPPRSPTGPGNSSSPRDSHRTPKELSISQMQAFEKLSRPNSHNTKTASPVKRTPACRDMSFLKWLEGTDEDSVEGDSNVKGIGPMSGGMTLLEDEEDDSSGSLRSEVDLSGEEEYTLAPGRHQAMASMDSMEVDLQMMMSPEFSLQEWLTLRRELDLLQVEDRRESQLPTGMPSEEHSHQQPVPPLEEDQLRMTPKPMTRQEEKERVERIRNFIYHSYRQAISQETEELFSSLEDRRDFELRSERMEKIMENQASKS